MRLLRVYPFAVTPPTRLLQLNLILLRYWHECLDMIFFFKLIRGIISFYYTLLASPVNNRRVTREASPTQSLNSPIKNRISVDRQDHRIPHQRNRPAITTSLNGF